MPDRMAPTPQEEVDEIDPVPIRGILLRNGQPDAEARHRCEENFVIGFPGLRVYVCAHGVTAENEFMSMGPESLFQAFTELWETAWPKDNLV